MKASSLLLDNYFIDKLSFSLNKDFEVLGDEDPELPSLKVRTDYSTINQETLERKCAIEISLSPDSVGEFPYYFDILMSGNFRVNPNLDAETGEKLFRVNAPALLYSAAREIIFNLSSHSEHQPFLLPSVTFIDEDPIASNNAPSASIKKAKTVKKPARTRKKTL